MIIRLFISLILLINSSLLFSQVSSPIGKWVLTEHLINRVQDDGYTKGLNIYNQEFSSTIEFYANGSFTHILKGNSLKGEWKLSKDKIKFQMKYENGTSIKLKSFKWNSFNFEIPLRLPEHFTELYTTTRDHDFGGTSVYVREDNSLGKDVSDKLLGKWNVCTGNELNVEETCSTFYYTSYTFKEDGTYTTDLDYSINDTSYSYQGTWKMINDSVLVIDNEDQKGLYIEPLQFEMSWLHDSLFYSVGIEGLKRGPKVYTYFRKKAVVMK